MFGDLVKEQCSVFIVSKASQEEMLSVFNATTTAQWRVRYVLGIYRYLMSYSLFINVCVRFVISDCL